MKKILITGADSYVGTCFEKYITENFEGYVIDTLDMRNDTWREVSFGGYDAVFHVAGLAHADVSTVTPEREALYYAINTDLAAATAQKAKADGARQFIFMSTILVYSTGSIFGKPMRISFDTEPTPATCYAKSKFYAEEKLRALADDNFCVSIIRSPMVYGKGSRGNYPTLSKMARKLPVFPKVRNERSMIYIENLCEMVRLLAENCDGGIFYPQNREYVSTSEMVRAIARAHGKKRLIVRGFGPLLHLVGKFTPLVNKAFGSLSYDMSMSEYRDDYRVVDFEESINRTER